MSLPPEERGARVISLRGDLGAGKTTFAKLFGKHLGVKEEVQSPTFLILKKYKTFNPFFEYFFHIDAYRLEKEEELSKLGLREILANPKNIVLIEWPEKVPTILPADTFQIFFFHVSESEREIDIPEELSWA